MKRLVEQDKWVITSKTAQEADQQAGRHPPRNGTSWYQEQAAGQGQVQIACFSAEFGFHESLPVYSGDWRSDPSFPGERSLPPAAWPPLFGQSSPDQRQFRLLVRASYRNNCASQIIYTSMICRTLQEWGFSYSLLLIIMSKEALICLGLCLKLQTHDDAMNWNYELYRNLIRGNRHIGGNLLKYNVVQRGDKVSKQLTERFHELAAGYGMVLEEAAPDIVLSIGGDGTMLHAFHQYVQQIERIAFVGIHTGRLGFFADWKPDEIEHLAELMHQTGSPEALRLVKYPVVEIEITSNAGIETHVALNEFTLKGIEETLVAQLNINDEMFEMFRGDGICISSPSGSTAYNKSLGGAIVHPALEAIQIAEIASINNRVYRTLGSPVILPKHHHCDIYPQSHQHMLLSLDNQYIQRTDVIAIRCRVAADVKVQFARFRPFPFWSRVKEAFIGYEVK